MSWYVRKTTKPLTLDHTIYYSFETKNEATNQTKKKLTQEKSQSSPEKQEKQKPKKRKETPTTDNVKPAKKKKTVAITEASFI